MNKKPLHDRVLVRRIEIGRKTASGIITANLDLDEESDTCFGKVEAVGPGKQLDATGNIPMTVTKGDTVVYSIRAGLRFKWATINYSILRESDIAMIVSGDDVTELDREEVAGFESSKMEFVPRARTIN